MQICLRETILEKARAATTAQDPSHVKVGADLPYAPVYWF